MGIGADLFIKYFKAKLSFGTGLTLATRFIPWLKKLFTSVTVSVPVTVSMSNTLISETSTSFPTTGGIVFEFTALKKEADVAGNVNSYRNALLMLSKVGLTVIAVIRVQFSKSLFL